VPLDHDPLKAGVIVGVFGLEVFESVGGHGSVPLLTRDSMP
jgi:hypothetical protein